MELSLLERLSGELPQGGYRGNRRRVFFRYAGGRKNMRKRNRHERLREVRYWVKGHLHEIEELREGGYSWQQIMHACMGIWKEAGIFSNVYPYKDKSLLRRCYTTVKKSETDPEELSDPLIEVQTQILIRRGLLD